MGLSPLEKAKRAFVSLLLLLARAHGLALGISRESLDPAVLTAFRRVSRKVHPDRGGSLAAPDQSGRGKAAPAYLKVALFQLAYALRNQ